MNQAEQRTKSDRKWAEEHMSGAIDSLYEVMRSISNGYKYDDDSLAQLLINIYLAKDDIEENISDYGNHIVANELAKIRAHRNQNDKYNDSVLGR